MSERLADVVERIDNMRQLDAVVTAMRGIAASRAQQSRTLISGIDAYTDTISRAIGQALNLTNAPATTARRRTSEKGLVVFVAEQGFAGAFSNRVIDAVLNDAGNGMQGTHIMMIGTRGIGIAADRGLKAAWTTAMANQIGNVPEIANRISDALYARIAKGEMSEVDMFYCQTDEERTLHVRHRQLLPIELDEFHPTPASVPPLSTLHPELLLARLTEEYIYAKLCEAAMHSFAAENEARTQAMSSANDNINKALTGLVEREHHVRQEEVTAEIVELATGVLAQAR